MARTGRISFSKKSDATAGAPVLPYGYETMALIALVPPLWRRIVAPLLSDWDQRLANDAERRLVFNQFAEREV